MPANQPTAPLRGGRLILQTSATLLVVLATAALAVQSVRTLRADSSYNQALDQIAAGKSNGIASLQQAVELRPDRVQYRQWIAQQESFLDPGAALLSAKRAVELDPYDWASWRTLGTIRYQLGQPRRAWQAFQQGLPVDRGFTAHFEAANLAFLLGKSDFFWSELRGALAIANPSQVQYALNLAMSRSAGNSQRITAILPDSRPQTMVSAVEYLVIRKRVLTAATAWNTVNDCPSFIANACGGASALIANALFAQAFADKSSFSQNRIEMAMRLWNHAVQAKWMNQGWARIGQNGDQQFQYAWNGPAFSWADDHVITHQIEQLPGQPGKAQIVFQLDGNEPQSAPLFHQLIAVRPNTRYEVDCKVRRQGADPQSGMLVQVSSPAKILIRSNLSVTSSWQTERRSFTTGKHDQLADLQVLYQRPNGQMLMRDPVAFAKIVLRPVPAAGAQ